MITLIDRDVRPESLQDRVERIYNDSRDDVYSYVRTFGLAAHEAQEIAQESFLRLYAAMKQGESIESPRGWVFRAAHNLALHSIERSKTRREFEPQLQIVSARADESAERRLIRQEEAARLKAALNDLSPQQRLCLQLRVEGLKYVEIAKLAGIGPSTVGEFLSRAVKRLRKAIDG